MLALVPLTASAGSGRAEAVAREPFFVGVVDDHSKWLAYPDGLIQRYRDLGMGAVRVSVPWKRGQSRPAKGQTLTLHRAAVMIARGQRVVLAVYGKPSEAPVTAEHRSQYCSFLRHVLRRVPFRDVVVWNEANSPQFWPKTAGAPAYEALLSRCWRELHALRPNVNVIGSTAVNHDPARFIRRLGAAYRQRYRSRPLVDTFGHNPYPLNAAEPPWTRHANPKVVGQGDLGRLLRAISRAFSGTAQPLPGTGRTTVWYLENGFQTVVPPEKLRYYNGTETDPFALPPIAPVGGPWAPDQARQLRAALLLARCQPAVGAYFNFLLLDEDRLAGWQSGLLYRDGTPKASYNTFREAVRVVTSGEVNCATVPGAGGPLPSP